MTKQRKATESLNVALAGVEAIVALLEQKHPINDTMVEKLRYYSDDARQHLTTIQFHLNQI